MSETTNLKLFKHDNPSTNTNLFDVEKALNENWDKIDEEVGDIYNNIGDIDNNTTTISNNLNTEISIRQGITNNLQNQINSLASGSPLVASSVSEMTDTGRVYVNTSDGHWYWHNGTAWVDGGVYQSTGIGNNSIQYYHTDFVENIGNLIIPSKIESGKLLSSSGLISSSSSNFITDFIHVVSGDTYIQEFLPNVVWYDYNKNYLDGIGGLNSGSNIVAPENAFYVRGCGTISNINNAILANLKYNHINNDHFYKIENLEYREVSDIKYKNLGNLFDKNNITENYTAFGGSQLNIYKSSQNFISDFIKIEENKSYVHNFINVIFFDTNKKYISGIDSANSQITSPQNACYMIGCGNISNLDTYYICDSNYNITTDVKYKLNNVIISEDNLDDNLKSKINISNLKELNMKHFVKADNYNSNFFNQYYFVGRWFKKTIDNVEYMCAVNHGSKIYAKVKNTENISINFKDMNTSGNSITIAYRIDDGNYIRNTINNAPFTISGLDTKEHYLEIVVDGIKDEDLTFTLINYVAFGGLTVDQNATIEPVKNRAKVGLFYGDSITAGCWLLAHSNPGIDNSATQNYVAECCKLLRCEDVRIAYSGIGILTGGMGSTPSFSNSPTNPIDYMAFGGYPEESQLPDFIVMNLGTNDSNKSDEDFRTALISVLERIQIKYPGVEIFLMRPFNGTKASIIEEVANECNNTLYIDTSLWSISTTDGLHPDISGSKIAGKNLANELLCYFGISFFRNV